MIYLKETVYILGAGVNQEAKDWDGHAPPLMNNFFNIALHKRKFSDDHFTKHVQDVYGYIQKYFKKTKDDLAKSRFDLEMCFTLLEREINRSKHEERTKEFKDLVTVKFHLESFLAEVLSEFEHFAGTSHSMRNLGRVIMWQRPTVITFNYDCLVESILESASGVNPSVPKSFREHRPFEKHELPDKLLTYSHYSWNRPLGYGFKFDEIELQQAGIGKFVRGSRFFSLQQNQLYLKPLLKLHGSLNWFRYVPIRTLPVFPGEQEPKFEGKESEILLKRGTWWFGRPPDHQGWLIVPVIITPILYKDEYYNQKPFREIWEAASNTLSKCKKLVVIGYSFSPTDFSTKHLLIDSFKNNDLDELIVVDPNHDVVKVVKDLCHFNGGVMWFGNMDDYLQSFSDFVLIEKKPMKTLEIDLPQDTTPRDLYAKCKTCGIEFPVGIRTNPRSHATSQYIGNLHACPNGHINSYDKEDYSLRKVIEPN